MKNRSSLLIGILCFVLIAMLQACDDDETKSPITYFTVNVDSKYANTAVENWVLIHSTAGEPLAAKKFAIGDVIAFDSISPPEVFSVTMVSYQGNNQYYLQTIHGVKKAESWNLTGPPAIDRGATLPMVNLKVSDTQLGSPFDATYSDGAGLFFPSSLSLTDFQLDIFPYSNLKYFISVVDKSGTPKYKFLTQAPTTAVNYTLADFSSFDKQTVVTFPATKNFFAYTMSVATSAEAFFTNGYMTNLRNSSNMYASGQQYSSTTLGYVNTLPISFTFVNASYQGYNLMYRASGPAPSANVSLTDNFNVSVTNKTWSGYALSSNDFSWFSTSWQSILNPSSPNPVYRSWYISSAAPTFKNATAFPKAFANAHPSLKIEDFVYGSTEIFKSSRTFEGFVSNNYKGEVTQTFEDRIKAIYN